MKTLASLGFLALSLTFAATGCSGGSSDADIVGIYQVDSFTDNTAACSEGGDSILGTDTFVLIQTTDFLGFKLLGATSCSSIADCESKNDAIAAGDSPISEFGFAFGGPQHESSSSSSGVSEDGTTCQGTTLTETKLTVEGDTITITDKVTNDIADFPVDSDGFCSVDSAKAAADGEPCGEQKTLHATLVEAVDAL